MKSTSLYSSISSDVLVGADIKAASKRVARLRKSPGVELAGALVHQSNCYHAAGAYEAALKSARQARALSSNFAPAIGAEIDALDMLAEFSSIIGIMERLEPLYPADLDGSAFIAYGSALAAIGEHSEAIGVLKRAVRFGSKTVEARYALACELLRVGRYADGWRELECRRHFWRSSSLLPSSLWAGQPIGARKLIIWREQGHGDTIFGLRYAQLLIESGCRPAIAVNRELVRLVGNSFPGADIIEVPNHALAFFRAGSSFAMCDMVAAEPRVIAEADLLAPVMSLPHALGTVDPLAAPYLRAEQSLVVRWARRLSDAARGDDFRVGLVWAGSPEFGTDHLRSPGLREFMPLLDAPGAHWFGLQMGAGRRDLERRTMPQNFTDLGSEIEDFADTAAIIESLDLVITPCTSVAHLAGAMGRQVWVVLPFDAYWVWGTRQHDCDFYPSARVFRQPKPKDWASVIAELRQALAVTNDRNRAPVTRPPPAKRSARITLQPAKECGRDGDQLK